MQQSFSLSEDKVTLQVGRPCGEPAGISLGTCSHSVEYQRLNSTDLETVTVGGPNSYTEINVNTF